MAHALERLLALLELDSGPPEPLPAIDGWELVLAENVAYLVDDDTRAQCMLALRRESDSIRRRSCRRNQNSSSRWSRHAPP
jgi:hypothetical protein